MIEKWEKVFIYVHEKIVIDEAWLTPLNGCVLANRNMWAVSAAGQVIEMVPAAQHMREMDESFQRGYQHGQFDMNEKFKGSLK